VHGGPGEETGGHVSNGSMLKAPLKEATTMFSGCGPGDAPTQIADTGSQRGAGTFVTRVARACLTVNPVDREGDHP
jgi:hypothetical protein